jgi:hypothetical protein
MEAVVHHSPRDKVSNRPDLSYRLCHRALMALRIKKSISLPPELAEDIERAAAAEGTTVSGWIARTAAHRLRLDAGRHAIAAWEVDHGALTAAELADALKQARALLRKPSRRRLSSRTA